MGIVHTEPSEKKHFHRFDKELFLTIQEFAHALLILTREAIKYLPLVDNTFVTKDKIKYQHSLKICWFNGQQTEESFLRPKEKKRHKKTKISLKMISTGIITLPFLLLCQQCLGMPLPQSRSLASDAAWYRGGGRTREGNWYKGGRNSHLGRLI